MTISKEIFLSSIILSFSFISMANMPAPPIDPVEICKNKKVGEACLLDYSDGKGTCQTIDNKFICVDIEAAAAPTAVEQPSIDAKTEIKSSDNLDNASLGCATLASFPGTFMALFSMLSCLILTIRFYKK